MDVLPLAFDSFGVRSQATFVEGVFIDAGVALGPTRYGLSPTSQENLALSLAERVIINHAKDAGVHVITHYHYDHYTPEFSQHCLEVYKGKRLLVKDPKENINQSQKTRARNFLSAVEDKCQVEFADNSSFDVGRLYINFSPAVWHGEIGSRVGKVVMCSVKKGSETFVFGSDAQGPLDPAAVDWIISEKPDTAILDGPITYMLGQWIGRKQIDEAVSDLKRIMTDTDVKIIVYDHHLVRDIKYMERMKPAYEFAGQHGVKLVTAAEFRGRDNLFLEAWRKKISVGEVHVPEMKVKAYF